MEAFWPQQPCSGKLDPGITHRDDDAHSLTDDELDREIRDGWDIWCELLDDLLSTGGMLPPRELASRVVGFFDYGYWRAEDARVEALRRQMASQRVRSCRAADRSRGIR